MTATAQPVNAVASSSAAAPRPGLLSLDEAVARLLAVASERVISQTEEVPTLQAWGRVLAEDVRSGLDVPPADNSSMDGYALRVADVPAAGVVLPVMQRIPAGVVGGPLAPGSAARIFTGAQIPAGADAVVMQEQCVPVGDQSPPQAVRVDTVPAFGQWIRRRGEDIQVGATVLSRGALLTPGHGLGGLGGARHAAGAAPAAGGLVFHGR